MTEFPFIGELFFHFIHLYLGVFRITEHTVRLTCNPHIYVANLPPSLALRMQSKVKKKISSSKSIEMM